MGNIAIAIAERPGILPQQAADVKAAPPVAAAASLALDSVPPIAATPPPPLEELQTLAGAVAKASLDNAALSLGADAVGKAVAPEGSAANVAVPTPKPRPLACSRMTGKHSKKWEICKVKEDIECQSMNRAVGSFTNVHACADKVFKNGGRFFGYAAGGRGGACWQESPGSNAERCRHFQDASQCCPQGYKANALMDYWIVAARKTTGAKRDKNPSSARHGDVGCCFFLTAPLVALAAAPTV